VDKMKITKNIIIDSLINRDSSSGKLSRNNPVRVLSVNPSPSDPSSFPFEIFKKDNNLQRYKFDNKSTIVTASDQNFVNGLYLLAWTALSKNQSRIICYDLGITDESFKRRMENLGVVFAKCEMPISKMYNGWQTLNKPWFIYDALMKYENVLWLDADAWVNSSLEYMLEATKNKLFIPDHGAISPHNQNKNIIYSYVDLPKVEWSGSYWPCAGIMGWSRRHIKVLEEWMDRLLFLQERGVIESLGYFDQGALQDVIDCNLEDGELWNYMRFMKAPSEPKFIFMLPYQKLKNSNGGAGGNSFANIYHAGGSFKPWINWLDMDWPSPINLSIDVDKVNNILGGI